MQQPALPAREAERLVALRRLDLLDTPPEPDFDDLARAASALCGAPVALLSLVDADRQWFKARLGLGASETGRDVAFCAHAILSPDSLLVVPDARLDARFDGNPLVDGPPYVIAYAGAPVVDLQSGLPLATLCVIDHVPREFTDVQLDGLRALGRIASRRLAERERRVVDERRRAEQEVVLDHVPVGVFLAGSDGALRYANAAFEMLADRAWEPGTSWWEMLEADEAVARQWSDRRTSARFAAEVLTGDRHLKVSAVPVRVGGVETGVVGVVQDVTTAERLQAALAESEGLLREAQQIAMIGHWRFTLATGEIEWSSMLYEIFGRNPRMGPPSFEEYLAAVHPDDRDALAQRIQAAVQEGRPYEVEHRVLRPDGTIHHLYSRSKVLRDAHGRISGLMGTAQDTTVAVQAREALEQARRDAEAGARAKADFLATMSHEIRTPLNGVTGMINLLLATDLGPEERHYADQANASSAALLALINDILDLSKIEAGKVDLEQRVFEVRQVVDETLPVAAVNGHTKGVEVYATFTGAGDRAFVGDSGRLRQVLTNLVGNAVKFTAAGEVRVNVDAGAGGLSVRVTDTGCGLTPAQMSRLFHPFSQADSSTTRKYGGTGLGLAICRRLVESMGGEIGVESAEGAGSTFWFRVPLPPAEVAERLPLPALRVGVAELHPGSRAATVETLARLGARPWSVDGLDALVGAQADAVIVDRRLLPLDVGAGLAALKARAPGVGRWVVLVDAAKPIQLPAGTSSLLRPVAASACAEGLRRWSGAAEVPNRPAPTPASVARLTALVAEDNPVNQMVASGLLRRLGCTVDVVADGRQAVAACRERSYDIVFMDCLMPEMDGFEATRALRADVRTRGLYVVALTANALEGDRQRCFDAGMDDFLAKPIEPVALRKLVEARGARLAVAGA